MMSDDLVMWRDAMLGDLRYLHPRKHPSGARMSPAIKKQIADALRRGFAAMALLDEVLPALDLAAEGQVAWVNRVRTEIGRILDGGPFTEVIPPPTET